MGLGCDGDVTWDTESEMAGGGGNKNYAGMKTL